jgi:hypothetical protein
MVGLGRFGGLAVGSLCTRSNPGIPPNPQPYGFPETKPGFFIDALTPSLSQPTSHSRGAYPPTADGLAP